jgi:CBS domain-containing protein
VTEALQVRENGENDDTDGAQVRLGELIGGTTEVCSGDLSLRDAARRMVAGEMGSMGVMVGARLVGIITERDLMKAIARGVDPDAATVDEWMTASVDTFSPHVEVEEAALWLLETGYRHLPVVEDERLAGILSMRDILAAVVNPA